MNLSGFLVVLLFICGFNTQTANALIYNCVDILVSIPVYNLPIERKLANGTIISVAPVGKGIFGAKYVEYQDGTQGVWKMDGTDPNGHSSNSEIAAYKIDRYLGLNKVPPTVAKVYNGKFGSVQLRMQNIKSLPDHYQYIRDPLEFGFFDYLIANGDRNPDNFLARKDGSVVAIDHGLAFHNRESLARINLEFNYGMFNSAKEKQHLLETQLNNEIDSIKIQELKKEITLAIQKQRLHLSFIQAFFPSKKVIEKLRATTYEDWTQLVGDNLVEPQIRQIMKRQHELLNSLDWVESQLGSELIYPVGSYRSVLPIRPIVLEY